MTYDEIYNDFYNNYTSGGLDGSVICDVAKVAEVNTLLNKVVEGLKEQVKNIENKFNILNSIVDASDLTSKVSISSDSIKQYPSELLTKLDILLKDIENNKEAIEFYSSLKNHNTRQAFFNSTLVLGNNLENAEGGIKLTNNQWQNIKNKANNVEALLNTNSSYVRSPYMYGTGHQNILFKMFQSGRSQFQPVYNNRNNLIIANPRFRNLQNTKIEDPFSEMNTKAAFSKSSLFTAYITKKSLESAAPKEIANTSKTSNRKTFKRATVISTETPSKVEAKPLEELYSPKVDKIEIPKIENTFNNENIPRLDDKIEEPVKTPIKDVVKDENSSNNKAFNNKDKITSATNKIASTISKSSNTKASSIASSISSLKKNDSLNQTKETIDFPKSKGTLSSLTHNLDSKKGDTLISKLINPNTNSNQSASSSPKIVASIIAGTIMAGGAGIGTKVYLNTKKEKDKKENNQIEPIEKIERLDEEVENPLSAEEKLSMLESNYL